MVAVIKLKNSRDADPMRLPGKAEKNDQMQTLIIRDGDTITGEFPLDNIEQWYNAPD